MSSFQNKVEKMNHHRRDKVHWQSVDYDELSEEYDQVRAGSPGLIRHLVGGASLKPGSLVLDIGCGTANNTILFAEVVDAIVVGVDLSGQMLAKAHGKAPGLDFIQSSVDPLSFPGDTFDFVFMTNVIHHIADLYSTLSEVHRVLNRRGLICIVTQSHKQIEERMTSKFFPSTVAIDKARYAGISETEKVMVSIGYTNVYSREHTLAPFLLTPGYLAIVEKKGYSSLHKINEEEFQKGLHAVRAALSRGDELRILTKYTFVWATKTAS
ncbi:MAG: class I SAM-dependent methyltransferase [Candidatus Thorarchaeota archaeon]